MLFAQTYFLFCPISLFDVQILWGGSNIATEMAVAAVAESGLIRKVKVFGIVDLSRNKAKMLLDPNSPLELMIDQSGLQIGYDAVKTTISVKNNCQDISS